MSDISEEELWSMSDEDLEAAVREVHADAASPNTEIEQDEDTSIPDEEEINEDNGDDEYVTVDEEEEEEDGSDKPDLQDEESGHDTSDETEEDEVDSDDTEEVDSDNPDGEDTDTDKESTEDAKESEEEEQPARKYSFRANGQDYEFSSEEIVEQFPNMFGKAMDYTKKLQAIKPWRKTIDAMENAKVSHEDVGLMIDVLKGDKDAITELLKRTGTDALELDTEVDSGYVAKDYGRDEKSLAINDIVSEISQDVEYSTTQNILSKEWDDKSWEALSSNPEDIRALHQDVKSGMYEKLKPLAAKLKLYGNGSKSDLEYYSDAATQHFKAIAEQTALSNKRTTAAIQAKETQRISDENAERVANAKAAADKRDKAKKSSVKRKAAAATKPASSNSVSDMLDDSDEGFNEWYKALQDSM